MKTIHRFALGNSANRINLGEGAEVLSVAGHKNSISLWAKVNTSVTMDDYRTFHVVGTGHFVPEEATRFVGTAILGEFVFHVFEEE